MPVLNYSIEVSTDATSFPVTLGDAKKACDIAESTSGHDEELRLLIRSATEAVENDSQRTLLTKTLVMKFDRFPDYDQPIKLKRGPIASVTSVQYVDESSVTQSFADYELDIPSEVIRPTYNNCWPTPRYHPRSVIVTYQAGSALPSVPKAAIDAIRLYIQNRFNGCEPRSMAFRNLINSFRAGDMF